MNMQEKEKFDFQKSLKKSPKFPVLKYFPIERYYTRPLASLIVRALYKTSITPNQITITTLFFGIASAISYCGGSHIYFILGGFLAQLGGILDCSDGMLARTKNLQSRFGGFLDLYVDRVGEFLVLSGIAFGYFMYSKNLRLLIIGLVVNALLNLLNTLNYLIEIYKQDGKTGKNAENRGLFVFIVFVLSLLNRLDVLFYILLIYSIGGIAYVTTDFIRLGRNQNFDKRS